MVEPIRKDELERSLETEQCDVQISQINERIRRDYYRSGPVMFSVTSVTQRVRNMLQKKYEAAGWTVHFKTEKGDWMVLQ